jgi:heme/copper-type cytochrome/quinol oxidase subunit 4
MPIHVALQVAAACCMFAGLGVILSTVSAQGFGHFNFAAATSTNYTHSIFGIIIISLIVVQMVLGIWSDIWWRVQVQPFLFVC